MFPASMQDAATAWTRANVEQFGGNPRRIFLMGHSAGGQIAALLALDPQYLQVVAMSPSRRCWRSALNSTSGACGGCGKLRARCRACFSARRHDSGRPTLRSPGSAGTRTGSVRAAGRGLPLRRPAHGLAEASALTGLPLERTLANR
jgi:poly(3-hydroxybutyrate) depolymerase